MSLLRGVFGWIVRHAILFALIVAAVIVNIWVQPSWKEARKLRTEVRKLEIGLAAVPAQARAAVTASNRTLIQAHDDTKAELDRRIRDRRAQLSLLQQAQATNLTAVFATGGADAVVANRRNALKIALLTREIDALTQLRASVDARRPGESLQTAYRRQVSIVRAQAAVARRAGNDLRRLEAENFFNRYRTRDRQATLKRQISQAQRTAAAAYRNGQLLRASQFRFAGASRRAEAALATTRAEFDALFESKRAKLAEYLSERVGSWFGGLDLGAILWKSALILLGIILTPFAIRTVFYYGLAPLVERRRAIRLGDAGQPVVTVAAATATSIGVRPARGEELLVRQGFLQSSARGGTKATQWLLDWRHPVSSIAAGLTFLTRVSAHEGALTTVSAVDDAFAEVAMIDLAEGAACVLQPRALVGVLQPVGRPLRIRGTWRLTTLAAWLTMQLRFLVFHGPAKLIVKGGRGVRVEPAEQGRVFGQDQLVGFSTDLAYSVTRTETFAPYLFGRESLLKDQVAEGGGVLIVEEAPGAGRKRGVRHGLEGLMDAGLKVFGI